MYQIVKVDIYSILEAYDYLVKAYDEIDQRKPEGMNLKVDRSIYHLLEVQGCLCSYVAYDKGELVGVLTLLVQPSLHNKGTKTACNDLMYISKEYRGTGLGKAMIERAHEDLKKLGVEWISLGFKEGKEPKFIKDLGYTPKEISYERSL